MPWRPLPRIAFAICTYPFQPSSPADLPLEIGDELYIIEQGGRDGSWYRGYLVAPPSLLAGLTSVKGQTLEARVFSGIFPRCCVEVREVLGEGKVNGQGEEHKEYFQDQGGRPSTRGAEDEPRSNGLLTPTESASASPLAGHQSRAVSKGSLGLALSARHPDQDSRLVRNGSHRTAQSELSQRVSLPLSPISVSSPRDPNTPRPLAPVPMLKIGDETPTSLEEPLVDEIASCLREWHSTKLHELLLGRRYGTLEKMTKLVQRLDSGRRQLLHNVLTRHELQTMREATVWDLVSGNKMLSGEVIVRSPSEKGRILTSEDSAIEITRLQSMMSLLNERPTQQLDEHLLHHLCVNIKHFTGDIKQPMTICVYLCSKTPDSRILPLSEVYMIDLATQEAAVIAASEEKMKTLFVDLSSVDIGEGAGAGTNLYLVFKVTTNEPFRAQPALPSPMSPTVSREGTPAPTPNGVTPSNSIGKGGRRSLMWGQKSRKESDANKHQPERPPTSNSGRRISEDKKPDGNSLRSPTPSNGAKTVKRVVGVGVMQINQLMKAQPEFEQDVGIFASAQPMDEQTEDNEGWDELIQELSPSASGRYKKYPGMSRLQVQIKAFANADAEALIKKLPTLLHNVSQTKKIGFSGAPTKPRSDIYVTLSEPYLPRNAQLSHPKSWQVGLNTTSSMANLQLTLEVRKSTGERIDNCIFPSGNSVGHTAWRTTACERGEAWNTTIRLAISPDDVPGSHVVMSLADAPGFPFALAWMPLWEQEAFIRDGDHALCLYKYDEHTSSMVSGRGIYLGLPWNSSKGFEAGLSATTATLRLRTYLCSTKYSQDPNLLGLLKWRDMSANEVADLLKRFVFVPEIEIVKLLREVLDTLFEILVQYSGKEELEDLVFNTLVMVLGITYDRRFNLEPLVDQYANTQFNFPFTTSCLIRSFHRLLANPVDTETSRKLRAAFKVGAHIFKFIMRAREQQVEKEAGIGIINRQSTFKKDLQSIFASLEDLMTNPAPILIGTKTLLVQHFHTWLPELATALSPKEVLDTAKSFVDSCANAQGKLILYKLILIIQFSSEESFNRPETRPELLAHTVRWLAPHWGKTSAVTQQWKDQVRLCCSVVASQINELGPEACEYIPKLVESYMAIQSTPRPAKQSLSLLFPTSYPFPSRQTTTNAEFDEALVEILAVLAATTNLPISIHPDLPKEELSDFLFNALQVYISSLEGEAFPRSWLSVNIYHHRSTMKTLEKLCGILIDCFLPHPDDAEHFNTDLWRAFFDALLKLVGSDALALETFPEQKRRAVWKIAGDVRELGAELLRRSWEAIGWETSTEDRRQYGLEKMGGYQVQYVPGLVAPIVELCLSVHQGLRGVAIEVLQTMIISEWTLSQDLSIIQTEMIDCLDRLFKTKALTDSILQKLFIGELIDLFEPLAQDEDDPLFTAVKDLINTIDELLDLLVAVHSTDATGEIFHIMDTLHLMEFLKDMQKEDIYIRYVHQLAQLQADAGNPTEAGLALRLHAELYEWNPTSMVSGLDEPHFPAQTAFERKEQLYFEMIKQYEDGQSWNNALGAYMELATQYETNIFDLSKLARTQRAMATVYESISKGHRENPRYFRVVYRGLGFPVGLRDKQFIFEASPNDRLATFTDRMQQQHPSAQISSGAGEDDMEGQYLQISAVGAQKDLMHPIYQRAKVAPSIRDYYIMSRPSRFTTPSRRKGSDAGLVVDQTVQRTVFVTAEAFPTILRRSEIVSVENITLSPAQTAIERSTRKTAELAALLKRVSGGEDSALQPLTEALMMSVDQLSPTSVAQYRDLLPKPAPPTDDEEELGIEPEEPQLTPFENALKVALLDHALAVKRCLGVYTRPAQQATAMDLTQRFEITFAPELEALSLGGQLPFFRSPNASYLHTTNSPDPSATHQNGASATLSVPPPHNRNATAPLPAADSNHRPTRHEKNRLSLTFLKRSSLTVDSLKRQQTNGTAPPAVAETSDSVRNGSTGNHSNGGSGVGGGRSGSHNSGGQRSRLSFLNPGASSSSAAVGEGDAVSSQKSRRSMSSERPKTSRSEQSGASQSLGDRVTGNVRKRFSMLNIGRGLQSKGSFLGGFGESVAEE